MAPAFNVAAIAKVITTPVNSVMNVLSPPSRTSASPTVQAAQGITKPPTKTIMIHRPIQTPQSLSQATLNAINKGPTVSEPKTQLDMMIQNNLKSQSQQLSTFIEGKIAGPTIRVQDLRDANARVSS